MGKRHATMGLFSKRNPEPPPALPPLRADIQTLLEEIPPAEAKQIVRVEAIPAVEYVNRQLPEDEAVRAIASGYKFPLFGCVALTNSRLVISMSEGAAAPRVTAIPLNDIRGLSYNPWGDGYATKVLFGVEEEIVLTVGGVQAYALQFLDALRTTVNTSGKYGL
jgi:hypothetical protein